MANERDKIIGAPLRRGEPMPEWAAAPGTNVVAACSYCIDMVIITIRNFDITLTGTAEAVCMNCIVAGRVPRSDDPLEVLQQTVDEVNEALGTAYTPDQLAQRVGERIGDERYRLPD